jgi:hypothetical protein
LSHDPQPQNTEFLSYNALQTFQVVNVIDLW